MNAITVTREYGAGGYEVARRLAEVLGWQLLDRELLHRAAAVEHLPDAELERLDEKAVTLADRLRLHPPHARYLHGLTEAARQAAEQGNVVLVGRGTGQLLAGLPNVFHLRLVASRERRAQRMARLEGWTLEQALARCAEQDRIRDRFTRYFFGDTPFHPGQYHLTAHTGWMPLEDVVACVAAVVRGAATIGQTAAGPRILTLARELAAGDNDFTRTLADRLGLKLYDQELLEQEAIRLGVTRAELEQVDEQPSGIFQRFRPAGLSQRYFETLGQLLKDLAARGDVLLVGRGGSRFLRDNPSAFHIRLVAALDVRIKRLMVHRWVRVERAQELLTESDARRSRFYERSFGASWSDPLEYHVTANGGLPRSIALDLIAQAAGRHWAIAR
jgi:cytidylate kinase